MAKQKPYHQYLYYNNTIFLSLRVSLWQYLNKKMAKGKKKLMSSAPWRGEEEATEEFQDAKLKVTKQQPGAESVMHVPRKKKDKSNRHDHDNNDDDSLVEIDPQLRYSFHRNYQVSWFFVFFGLPRWENSCLLALNWVYFNTQFLVSWLLGIGCLKYMSLWLVVDAFAVLGLGTVPCCC